MPELFPRFGRSQERIDDQRRIAEVILEGEEMVLGPNGWGFRRY